MMRSTSKECLEEPERLQLAELVAPAPSLQLLWQPELHQPFFSSSSLPFVAVPQVASGVFAPSPRWQAELWPPSQPVLHSLLQPVIHVVREALLLPPSPSRPSRA